MFEEIVTIEHLELLINDSVASYIILDNIEKSYKVPWYILRRSNEELIRITQNILVLLVKLDEKIEIETNNYERQSFERFEAATLKAIGIRKK